MKKYKNKRTGDVVEQDGYNKYLYKHFDFNLSAAMVEDSCDWEEIVDKAPEYEIMKISCKPITSFGKPHIRDFPSGQKWEIFDKHWNIHSIKRNSDGEIFKIHDNVQIQNFGKPATILKFKIDNNVSCGMVVGFEEICAEVPITKIKKFVKVPLFTIEQQQEIIDLIRKYK